MKKDDTVYLRHIIRNKIVHEYLNVNFSIVWDTVQDDLPLLKEAIRKLL